MSDPTRFQFTNPSVPKAYDEYLVPRLFDPWARLVVEEANLRGGEAVLDVATGPGTVARLAAERVAHSGRVVGIDIAPAMLALARAKPPPANTAPIDYIESPASPLPVPDQTFDVIFCQQGLQFFPDRLAALREMRRVLKPGGRAAIAVWGTLDRNKIYAVFHASLRAVGANELAEIITAPFSWPDGSALESAARQAGFSKTRTLTRSMDLVFEGGLDQAVAAFAATPVAPAMAAMPQDRQSVFFAALRRGFEPLLVNGAVRGEMTSNILVAHVDL